MRMLGFSLFIYFLISQSNAENNFYVKETSPSISDSKLRELNTTGIKELGAKNYSAAVKTYSEFIKHSPKLALGYANRGNAYMNLHQFEKAFSDLEQAVKLDPSMSSLVDPANALVEQGMADIESGNFDAAETHLVKAAEKNPKNSIAWNELAFLSSRKGEYKRCIDFSSKAITTKPDYSKAFASRGGCHSGQGEYKEALKDLDQSIKLEPKVASSFLMRAGVNAALKKCDLVKADLANAKALDSSLQSEINQVNQICAIK